jgi:hypothetical protein
MRQLFQSNKSCVFQQIPTAVCASLLRVSTIYGVHSSRDDLGLYLKVLRSSMIELINEDYADFVNLSTNLVGLDTVILRLKEPLLKHQARALDQALKLFLSTGAFLFVRQSFLLISNKFCDLSLLLWLCSGRYRDVGGGGRAVKKFTALGPGSSLRHCFIREPI